MSFDAIIRAGTLSAALVTCALVPVSRAQAVPAQEQPAPDNTKVNKRDRNRRQPTSDQAKENRSDRETMQQIRKAVVADKSLSNYAHNVKIIAQNGKVTLKGPVRSEEEKRAVEAKAVEVAGAGNVSNELTIKPESDKNKAERSK